MTHPQRRRSVKKVTKKPYITPAQVVNSDSETFWAWNKENPIGNARPEKTRLKVRK